MYRPFNNPILDNPRRISIVGGHRTHRDIISSGVEGNFINWDYRCDDIVYLRSRAGDGEDYGFRNTGTGLMVAIEGPNDRFGSPYSALFVHRFLDEIGRGDSTPTMLIRHPDEAEVPEGVELSRFDSIVTPGNFKDYNHCEGLVDVVIEFVDMHRPEILL